MRASAYLNASKVALRSGAEISSRLKASSTAIMTCMQIIDNFCMSWNRSCSEYYSLLGKMLLNLGCHSASDPGGVTLATAAEATLLIYNDSYSEVKARVPWHGRVDRL